MLTTKQVREVMAKHGLGAEYTNKTTGHTGANRRVKCYHNGNDALLKVLIAVAGAENVKLTRGGYSGRGIVVKCVLA